jgi:hypothetical protein
MNTIIRFYIVAAIAAFIVACGSGGNGTSPALSGNARLVGLSISVAEFDQIFQPNQQNYTATVSLLRSTTAVTPVTEDANASVTVDGAPVISGTASGDITLDEGINTITVVVTAEDGVTTGTYTIDITRQTAASFAQQAYIKTSNTDSSDQFGNAVVISGDTLAVGAWSEDSAATGIDGDQSDNAANDSGAVYVFTRDPAGVWSQQAYIKASNTDAGDHFGVSIALSGDTLAVGAPGEGSEATGVEGDQNNNNALYSGAAYVFTRDPAGVWSQQAYIKASNTGPGDPRTATGDNFGNSIALSGDTLAVAAWGEDSSATGIDGDQSDEDGEDSGAVYVFTRNGSGLWTQQAYIKASNTDIRDRFGHSVALAGDTLAVSASWESSDATGINGDQNNNNADFSGAVYIFTRDGAGVWTQHTYVKASNTKAADEFGWAVDLSTDSLAVGARGEQGLSGAVYLFSRNGDGAWSQQAYIKASNAGERDQFGWSVALSGDALVVGARLEDSAATGIGGDPADDSAEDSGAAYLFMRDAAGTWLQQAYIKASNTNAGDWFGGSVAVNADALVIGANFEDSAATGINGDQSDNSAAAAGAVYVY